MNHDDRLERVRRLCPGTWAMGWEFEQPEPGEPDDDRADETDDGAQMVQSRAERWTPAL